MSAPDRSHALDHIVVVLFENRSLDNVLGHLYGPGDGKNFDGVIGKDLSNPIPAWAEHGAERKVVPYTVATDMDSPNPDSGEEYFHTNTQLFNILDDHNRFKIGEEAAAPWNAPPPGAVPSRPTRAGPAAGPVRATGRARLHLRPLRVPGTGRPRVAVG
jgi:phospholipase C